MLFRQLNQAGHKGHFNLTCLKTLVFLLEGPFESEEKKSLEISNLRHTKKNYFEFQMADLTEEESC